MGVGVIREAAIVIGGVNVECDGFGQAHWQAIGRGLENQLADESGDIRGRAAELVCARSDRGHASQRQETSFARIIEATSKLDALRVLDEAGVPAPSYRTVTRRLPLCSKQSWRKSLSVACAAHAALGPASLVLYDVSTVYFENDQGDGFREPGFSKERRLEPQLFEA